ncbi:hypothetical protein OBBRIDRAFT_735743, partial [Obba rivulosa]
MATARHRIRSNFVFPNSESRVLLPPELEERILDFLWNDPASLCQCALVYRSWLPRCRYHIYTSLRI